jgi:hypothetical protein
MVLVGVPGARWSGSRAVAESFHHWRYQAVSGSARWLQVRGRASGQNLTASIVNTSSAVERERTTKNVLAAGWSPGYLARASFIASRSRVFVADAVDILLGPGVDSVSSTREWIAPPAE